MELEPRHTSGYKYHKALETIKIFGLGDCEINRHSNNDIFTCRFDLLQRHFQSFYFLVKALTEKDKKATAFAIKKSNLESYGFCQFILRGHYINLIP